MLRRSVTSSASLFFFAAVFFAVVDFFVAEDFFVVEDFFDVDEVFEDVDFFAEVVFFAVEEEAVPVTDRKALYTFAPLVTLDGSLPLSSVITITSCLLASWNPIR